MYIYMYIYIYIIYYKVNNKNMYCRLLILCIIYIYIYIINQCKSYIHLMHMILVVNHPTFGLSYFGNIWWPIPCVAQGSSFPICVVQSTVIQTLGIQSHCDMMIRGSNHTLIMVVTILRRWLDTAKLSRLFFSRKLPNPFSGFRTELVLREIW